MSTWDHFRSIVIFVAAVYVVDGTFESVSIFESILLVLLMAVCVFHTMDIRDDITKRIEKRRKSKEE